MGKYFEGTVGVFRREGREGVSSLSELAGKKEASPRLRLGDVGDETPPPFRRGDIEESFKKPKSGPVRRGSARRERPGSKKRCQRAGIG